MWAFRGGAARARTHAVLALAVVLFAAIFALRIVAAQPGDAVLVLCVIPIVLCAIERGALGAVLASAVGVALTAAWSAHADAAVGPLGYGSRGVAFLGAGLVVARYASARRASQRELDRAYEVAVDLQCTAGFDGFFKRVNPAGCTLLGYTEAELLARPFLDFVHPDDQASTRREVEKLAGAGEPTVDFENRYRRHDGSYLWLAWTARAVADEGLIYASARDVTERHDRRADLERLVAERTHELQAARLENLRRLALAAEYRDDETHQHTERVGALAALLAERLRLPTGFTKDLRYAAPLHDVGKLGVPDAILLKPGRLTDAEHRTMRTHTEIGGAILADSAFPVLRLGEQIALTHHERWDGAGYPRGLHGDAIPLAGRIVAVADVLDALTHARPYKPAWPLQEALDEIRAGSGTQFDPRVVAALDELHRDGLVDAVAASPGPVPAPAPAPEPAPGPASLRLAG